MRGTRGTGESTRAAPALWRWRMRRAAQLHQDKQAVYAPCSPVLLALRQGDHSCAAHLEAPLCT